MHWPSSQIGVRMYSAVNGAPSARWHWHSPEAAWPPPQRRGEGGQHRRAQGGGEGLFLHLRRGDAQHPRRRRVGEAHPAFGVDADDAVPRRVEDQLVAGFQLLQFGFALLQRGDIGADADDAAVAGTVFAVDQPGAVGHPLQRRAAIGGAVRLKSLFEETLQVGAGIAVKPPLGGVVHDLDEAASDGEGVVDAGEHRANAGIRQNQAVLGVVEGEALADRLDGVGQLLFGPVGAAFRLHLARDGGADVVQAGAHVGDVGQHALDLAGEFRTRPQVLGEAAGDLGAQAVDDFQSVQAAAGEIGVEAGVVDGKTIDEIVGHRAVRLVEKGDRGQGLVDVDPEEFAEGGKPRRRARPQAGQLVQAILVVEPPQDAVVEDHRQGLGLAGEEGGDVGSGLRREVGGLQQQFVALMDVAEEVQAVRRVVDARHRTDENLAVEFDAEGVPDQFSGQTGGIGAEGFGQKADRRAHRVAVRVEQGGDGARRRVGIDHHEGLSGLAEVLAFQHAIALAGGELDEGDHRRVGAHGVAVEQPGGGKVQASARRAADEQAGEAPGLIGRLHQEVLAPRQSIDEGEGQGVAGIDGERQFDAGEFGGDRLHPVRAAGQIDGTHRRAQQAGRENLHHQMGARLVHRAVERVGGGGAQLARRGHRHQRGFPGQGLEAAAGRREVEEGGDEGDRQGRRLAVETEIGGADGGESAVVENDAHRVR